MGYGLISKNLLAKNEAAAAKGQALLAKLVPLQGKFGIAAIIIGIIYHFLYDALSGLAGFFSQLCTPRKPRGVFYSF
jgi:ABC-type sulfate transport system permease subunit